MHIRSTAFGDQRSIPPVYTCQGPGRSPPLTFVGVPRQARSLALIVDDPDAPDPAAPKVTWVHWVLYDLPPSTPGLADDVAHGKLPAGARVGSNGWNKPGWGGPCPPIGRHRYFFKLYALDVVLGDRGALTAHQLERAMKGHVLAQTQWVGTYQKSR